MNRHVAYQEVARELNRIRQLDFAEVESFLGDARLLRVIGTGDEQISVELSVRRIDGRADALSVEVVAHDSNWYKNDWVSDSVVLTA